MSDYYALAYIMKSPDATTPPTNLVGPQGSVVLADSNGGLTYSSNLQFTENTMLGITGTVKASQIVFDNSNVRIGVASGLISQTSTAIAIGAGAGQSNQQANAIAIGTLAGQTNQAANSIILNASGSNLDNSGNPSSFYVNPIRNETTATNFNSYLPLSYNSTTREIVYFASYGPPVGTIIQFAGNTAPTGYLKCGATSNIVNISLYPALAAVLGTTWGGNGTTTFGLPFFPTGYAVIPGASVNQTLNGTIPSHSHGVNETAHSHTASSTPHNHGITDGGHTHPFSYSALNSVPSGGILNGFAGGNITQQTFAGTTTSASTGITINNATASVTVATASTGITIQTFGTGSVNIPASISLLYCVKYL